jgi:hypothetical protein
VATSLAMVAAALACAWLLRDGLAPTFDAASYLSATREVAEGHPLTTRVAPSFSNFSVVEFLDRGGRLPFVDFPAGYPLVAGPFAVVVGPEAALVVVTVAAVVAVAGLTVAGADGRHADGPTLALRAVAGVAIVSLPAYQVVTRSVLSEPLFCAVVVGLLAALLHHRRTGRGWAWCVALAATAGLVRFVGAPLALLVGLEHRRRHGSWPRAAAWTAACALPAALNVVWADAMGGGHGAGWRGLHGSDVRLFVRSVGGWLDARQGNLGLAYFGDAGAAWWSWPVTIAWLAAGVVALAGLAGLGRRLLPEPLELALAASIILAAGIAVGMAGFDDLVAPENRVLLPVGVVVAVGVAWSLRPTARWPAAAAAAGLAAWIALAVVPRGPNHFGVQPEPASAAVARGAAASIVIGPDADTMSWWTGLPAGHLPQPSVALTGEQVDTAALWAALPCALVRADAVVVLVDGATFFGDPRPHLDGLVAAGRLTPEPGEGATTYRPTPQDCPG